MSVDTFFSQARSIFGANPKYDGKSLLDNWLITLT